MGKGGIKNKMCVQVLRNKIIMFRFADEIRIGKMFNN